LKKFLRDSRTQQSVSRFCNTCDIQWKFIPERAPHFGGIWESANLKRILSPVKLTYEEFSTQVEACLNSRPLIPQQSHSDDGVVVLTPGHFLVGRPLTALPDSPLSYRAISLLKRWHLCQIVRHFWERWQNEYLCSLNKFNKWHFPSRNITVDDIVILNESNMLPTKWPLARVMAVHPGSDDVVRLLRHPKEPLEDRLPRLQSCSRSKLNPRTKTLNSKKL